MGIYSISPLRTFRTEDIPREYQDIAETLGMKAFLLLADLCGGQNLYIPKMESLE